MVQNQSDDSDDSTYHSSSTTTEDDDSSTNNPFKESDRVYKWCSHLGLIYQHHGIVIEVPNRNKMIIVDFYLDNYPQERQQSSGGGSCASLRSSCSVDVGNSCDIRRSIAGPGKIRYLEVIGQDKINEWKKVHYGYESNNNDDDTISTTTESSDPRYLVVSRVKLLLSDPSVLPDYDVLKSNCECVAVWCKTGKWSILQGALLLEISNFVTSMTSRLVWDAACATETLAVSVPSAGIWGWLGYTEAATVTAPVFSPAMIVAMGLGAGATIALS